MRSTEGCVYISFAMIRALEKYPTEVWVDVLKTVYNYVVGCQKPWMDLQDEDVRNLARLACTMQTRQNRVRTRGA